MADQPRVTAIRNVHVEEMRIVSQAEWDEIWKRAMPVQRRADITLSIAAVYKDGVYYIAEGNLEWKTESSKEG